MKALILVLLCSTANAKEFKFKYALNGEILEIKTSMESWEKALEFSADKCFKHFIKQKPYSEEYGLDVIDVCANPR